jgi:hypothetical protein
MKLGLVAFAVAPLIALFGIASPAVAGGIPAGATEAPVAKGVPGTISADSSGLTAPAGRDRYIELPATRGNVIARVDQSGGEVLRSAAFKGGLSIPAVAYDGTPGGLSADGNTLVLLPPQSDRGRTTFSVLDAERLRVRDRVTLRGAFSFDAISPDGSRIYLIEYTSPFDPTRYAVRAYDTGSGRLLREPIVDPEEPPGEMRGTAVSRATSPDGRWAYTLYNGHKYPFVHALDTVNGRAVCIDLDALAEYKGAHRWDLTANSDGSVLTVSDQKQGPLALVNTETFEVSDLSEGSDGGGFPWLLAALASGALLAAWVLAVGLRRRGRVAPGDAR